MKVSIKIDAIGKSLDNYVKDELADVGLPNCIGSMIPPLLNRIVQMDLGNLFQPRSAVEDGDIVGKCDNLIVGADAEDLETDAIDKVLTKNGRDYIEDYKKKKSHEYVTQVAKCTGCEYIDVCYKLTRNYLQLIQLEKMFKKEEL